MSNQNVADISTFEGIQKQTNESIGCKSQMAVFNSQDDVTAVKTACEVYGRVLDDTIKQVSDPKIAQEKLLIVRQNYINQHGKDVFFLKANGQSFTIADRREADKALEQAKDAKVVEV